MQYGQMRASCLPAATRTSQGSTSRHVRTCEARAWPGLHGFPTPGRHSQRQGMGNARVHGPGESCDILRRDYLAREAVSDASHAVSLNLASLPYPSHDPGMRYGTSSDGCPQADAYGHARADRDSVAGANSNPNHKRSTACQRHAGGGYRAGGDSHHATNGHFRSLAPSK